MKQTAVEWLIQELNKKIDFISMDKWDMIIDILQQAKAMEKEQIMNAWDMGISVQDTNDICSEYYYNETFKQDQ